MIEILSMVPARRRDAIYAEICRLVNEVDAVDRSLEGMGEGIAVDEALEEICDLIGAELQSVRKTSRQMAKRTRKTEITCPA